MYRPVCTMALVVSALALALMQTKPMAEPFDHRSKLGRLRDRQIPAFLTP
jgi:hypothetical protein